MAVLSATWSDPRPHAAGLLAIRWPEMAARVKYDGNQTLVFAMASAFEAVTGKLATVSTLDFAADSMGGVEIQLVLEGEGERLELRASCGLSDSWQGVETREFSFAFSGQPGVDWQLEADFAGQPSLRSALTGVTDQVATAVEAALAEVFAQRTYALSPEAVKSGVWSLCGGGYDHNHEWNPDHSLSEKIDGLDALLNRWFDTDLAGRAQMIEFATELVAEDGPWPGRMAGVLLQHWGKVAVAELVGRSLSSGAFCRDLLSAAKPTGGLPQDWREAIRSRVENRSFSERKRSFNLSRLYRDVAALLGDGGEFDK
jgi:hypothetical protein